MSGSYTASAEAPVLHVSYAETLADALFLAAAAVRKVEPRAAGFDVNVCPPGSWGGADWVVNVYEITKDDYFHD